MTLKFSLI